MRRRRSSLEEAGVRDPGRKSGSDFFFLREAGQLSSAIPKHLLGVWPLATTRWARAQRPRDAGTEATPSGGEVAGGAGPAPGFLED